MATTSTYPIVTPKVEDLIVGTQTYTEEDPVLDNPTSNFTIESIVSLVESSAGVQSLNSLAGNLNVVAGNAGINVTTNGSNEIIITNAGTGGNYLEDVFVTGGVAQLGVVLTIPEGSVSLTDDFANTAKIIEVSFPSTLTSTSTSSFASNLLTEIDVNNITNIGTQSFFTNPYLNTLNLRSVQTIGNYAFHSTGYLSNGYDLVFPSTLTSIGTNAFGGSKINSVTFDAANQVTNLQTAAFANTSSFTSIDLPSNLVTIGNSAFYGSDLTSIIVPNSVTSIGTQVFEASPLTSAVINNGTVGNYAFRNITTLTSLTLNSGVTSIGDQSFLNLGVTTVTIPSTVTSMGDAAFYGNLSLTSAIINSTVIGTLAFKSSPLLSTVTLSNNLLSIGNDAFMLTGLTSIAIPNTVTSLGTNSFQNTSLSSIVFDSASSITDIPQGCFSLSWGNNRTVTTLTLPSSLQTFGTSSFQQAGIETLTIPNTTTTIGGRAFEGQRYTTFAGTDPALDWTDAVRRGLNTLTFDATSVLTTIGNDAFVYNNIGSLVIPASVTSIGQNAFRYNNLTSVILPATVTTVGSDSFSNNPNLTSVTINSTQVNASQAFDNIATTITTVNIGPGVTAASGIFTGSTGIGTLDIAANAVTNNNSFINLAIGTLTVNGTATIGAYSFTNSTITLGTIGDGITLPQQAFGYADFTTLNIGDNATLGIQAFYTSVITTLNIGDNLTTFLGSFYSATIGTMTIGNDAEIATTTFNSSSTITGDLTIGDNANLGLQSFRDCNIFNLVIGDNAVVAGAVGNAIGGAFYNANITGNVTIGLNADIQPYGFSRSDITGNLTIGINSNIGIAAFYDNTIASVINSLTIGSGSALGSQSFSSHTYSSFSLGNNLTFGSSVFNNATLTGDFTIDPTWTLVQDSLDQMNITGDFIVPNNEVLPISVFSGGSITGDLVLGTGVTLPDDCFRATDITGDLTIPISTVFTGNQHFYGSNIGTVNISDNFVLVDGMFYNVTVNTMTLGNNITVPNLTCITGAITNMTVGDNLVGTFANQTPQVTNMTFGSNSTLNSSSSARYSNLTIGLGNTLPSSAFFECEITNLIIPAPTSVSEINTFTGSSHFYGNNISALPDYFSSSFVNSFPNTIFGSNAFSGNITFPSNILTFNTGCFRDNNITGITNASPAYNIALGDQVFYNNNFTSIPDFLSGISTGIIPSYTFYSNNFTSITVDATNSPWIRKFDSYCFLENSSLTTLSFDAGNTNHGTFFGYNAFGNCNISSVTFLATGTGSWSTSIMSSAVFQNNNLSVLPTGLYGTGSAVGATTITGSTFQNNSFTGSLTIPDGVTSIQNLAFTDNAITNVSVAAGTTITSGAFDPGVTITYRP